VISLAWLGSFFGLVDKRHAADAHSAVKLTAFMLRQIIVDVHISGKARRLDSDFQDLGITAEKKKTKKPSSIIAIV